MKNFEKDNLYDSIVMLMEQPLLANAKVQYHVDKTRNGRFDVVAILVASFDRYHSKEFHSVECTINTFDTRDDALTFSSVLLCLPEYEQLKLFVTKYRELNNLNIDSNYGEW